LKYEAPIDRKIELNPRIALALESEARARNTTVANAAEGIIGEWLMMKANKEIMARVEAERV
jgi:hypothetical protein